MLKKFLSPKILIAGTTLFVLIVLIVIWQAFNPDNLNTTLVNSNQKVMTKDIKNDLQYTNKQYGFQLVLPDTWENYQLKQAPNLYTQCRDCNKLDFILPTKDLDWAGYYHETVNQVISGYALAMTVSVFDLKDYKFRKLQEQHQDCSLVNSADCWFHGSYLGETERYVFLITRPTSQPQDWLGTYDMAKEILGIRQSFDLVKYKRFN